VTGSAARRPLVVAHSFPEWLPLTQTWLHSQVARTPASAVEAHVLCERTANLDQFAVPRLHVLARAGSVARLWDRGLRKIGARRHLGFYVRTARRHGVRVLHSHFGNVGWADVPVARALGVPHVTTFYGFDVQKLPTSDPRWRDRYAELFASTARVLCEGSHMARQVVALGCPADRVRVQHLGVDLDAIAFSERRRAPGEPLRVLVAGTFREKKGIPDALRAVALARREVPVEVTLVGDAGPDAASQQEKARIERVIDADALGPHVRRPGYQSHRALLDLAERHHIFLSPSRTASDGDTEGGSPVTITELSASGMPVVSTRHCDIPEVVRDGESGLLAAEGDVEALARHLLTLAAAPERWGAMGRAGRAHIAAEYDARRQGERLAAVYHEVAAA
jgi:colanic acid/amylovoran biosynthesis glycosyltransferase